MNNREDFEAAGAQICSVLAGGFAFGRRGDPACQGGRTVVRASRWVPAFALSLSMLAAGGCQLLETRERDPSPSPGPGAEQPSAEPIREADLSTAMRYLEAGRGEAARAVLAALAEDAPNSGVLVSLLRQIEQPPEQLLPGPYRQVEIGPGESLSLIAARELGDPLMFFALARLNGIEVPARVPVGTVLRVPETPEDRRQSDQSAGDADSVPQEVTVPEIESVARYLASNGQIDQARAVLIGRLGEGVGTDSTRELLADLTLERAAEMRAEGALARAVEMIEEALEVMGASGSRANLAERREELRSEMLREDALGLRDQGKLVDAYRAAQSAASLDSTAHEAASLADELRTELVGSLHNDALVAWRDRNVDLAIRTWESLLEAVPDFEPARVYLERARTLREKLDEP